MSRIPAGSLTFLFTDIEGSTLRWEQDHAAMSAALVRHDDLVRSAIETHGGHVFKTVGDAFCAAFADAGAALAAAVAGQRALVAEDWSAFGPDFAVLRIRAGLHTGAAEARGGDYFGPALNRTARLTSAGHGGQVLISLAVQQVVHGRLPDGVRLRDWGEHRLKDLHHSEHIWQVLVSDLPDVRKPPTTAEALTPGDRIVVAEAGAPARPLPESMRALLEAVRGETATVTLSPDQAREIAQHRPADLAAFRLGRIAEWSQPRYRLDGRFVALTLLVDQGEEVTGDRWVAKQERYDDLGALLAAGSESALVVLGPPGSGKSTLLRRLELDTAIAGLRGEDASDTVTFFVQLNQYKPDAVGGDPPLPGAWLADRWAERFPDLRPLGDLLAEGRVILLLDALNEMPAANARELRQRVSGWKDWLVRLATDRPGNRVVFSCRTLDYSAPLSTPALRVPQVQIEPLTDEQVAAFLRLYSPVRGEDIWSAIAGTPQLEALRSPFYLALLVDQVEATGDLAEDRAGLFTGFVRQAMRREVERDNPLFALEDLLDSRDVRRIAQWRWRDAYELPERGVLVPKLAALAYGMQEAAADGGASQVRVSFDQSLELVDHPHDEAIVKAGVAISVLDEDPAADEVLYRHQLLQEYFAARVLAREPRPALVAAAWRTDEVGPGLREVLAALPPSETLPALPQTGWEETTILAAAMVGEPEPFLRALVAPNLVVAGRVARLPGVRAKLGAGFLDELRWALVARSRDPSADLRARIDAGLVLGWLGDPRFERRAGPHGAYLLPPVVAIPGGDYPIGDDDVIAYVSGTSTSHQPRHTVRIAPFELGRFPVTNAEFACFVDAGGYEDERWWDTAAGRAWRQGAGTADGLHANVRYWVAKFKAEPALMDEFVARGQWDQALYERGRRRVAMSDEELTAHLFELYPEQRFTEPRYWRDARFHSPLQPVVGVCWYEARAYACWLGAQIGRAVRLPSEVEWEAATRGHEGRNYAYGDGFDALAANTLETRLKRPSPVGVFPEGDTPEGASDLSGNVYEWTCSLYGASDVDADYGYPYRADDGRENAEAGSDILRVYRGGAWGSDRGIARAAYRVVNRPAISNATRGFRVAMPPV